MATKRNSSGQRQKGALRREIRQKLKLLTDRTKAAAAKALCKRLALHPNIGDAPMVAAFMALATEPDLSEYLRSRLSRGLPVLLPRIIGDPLDGIMEFRVVRRWGEDFKPGPMGILEPGDHCPVHAGTALPKGGGAIDVVLVPGLAFDRSGHRMGKGGGHYDRFLKLATVGKKIGVGFLCQRVETVPVELHDVKLDEVLLV